MPSCHWLSWTHESTADFTWLHCGHMTFNVTRGGAILRCIDISRYFSCDTYRDIIFSNRNFLVSIFCFFAKSMVLGKTSSGPLNGSDRLLRGAIRKWSRLPHDPAVGYFHAGAVDGGLGIPSFRTSVPGLRDCRMGKQPTAGTEADVQAATRSRAFAYYTMRRNPGIMFRGKRTTSCAIAGATWRERLLDTRDK